MTRKAAKPTFSDRLLEWFDQHGRKNLPWQKKVTPYRVWISEIMLQQTQVSTVIPYFENFMRHFPTIESLAAASLDEVLHHWSGLGYYARARNLHTTAKSIVEKHDGRLPDTVRELSLLPGIGPSTAGAIIGIAYQKRAAILDGNVKRVLARHFALPGIPVAGKAEEAFWKVAEQLTPAIRVNDYTQAIMDLGATLCTRTQPRCEECPLKKTCIARKQGSQSDFPEKRLKSGKIPMKETRMLLIVNPQQEVYLQKRPLQGIWGGLWSLPELDMNAPASHWCRKTFGVAVKKSASLDEMRHTFSHYHLRIHPLVLELAKAPKETRVRDGESDELWYNFVSGERHMLKKGLAAPVSRLLKQLEAPFKQTH